MLTLGSRVLQIDGGTIDFRGFGGGGGRRSDDGANGVAPGRGARPAPGRQHSVAVVGRRRRRGL